MTGDSMPGRQATSKASPSEDKLLARREGLGKAFVPGGHEWKQPAEKEPKSFTFFSPSERSTSSSRLSKFDSSPSSSTPSSSSSFTETGSFAAADDFTPASVTSSKVHANVSPSKSSAHRVNLARKLAAVAPVSKWDDTEMHAAGCNLQKPVQSRVLRKDIADVRNLERNYVDSIKAKKPFPCKPRDKYLWYDGSNYPDNDKATPIFSEYPRLVGRKVECTKPLAGSHTERLSTSSCSIPPQFNNKRSSDPPNQRSHNKDWIDVYFTPVISAPSPEIHRKASTHAGSKIAVGNSKDIPLQQGTTRHRRVYANAQLKDVECNMPMDDVINSICDVSSKAGNSCSMVVGIAHEDRIKAARPLNDGTRSDSQVRPNCVLKCSTSPYEAAIGMDIVSLQPHMSSFSPYNETRLPSALSLHRGGPPIGKPLSLQLPAAHKPTPKRPAPSGLSDEGVPYTSFGKTCNLPDSVSGQKNKTISSSSTRFSSAATTRSLPTAHVQDDQQKVGRPPLVLPLSKARVYHDDASKSKESSHVSSSSGIKYTDKADAFVPHSPLLLKEAKVLEGRDAPSEVAPAPLPSKALWDWRSKSTGAKASLKSAVRNLEAKFSGSRSVSLPKARTPAQKEPKSETASLLDRVFVSPMRGRRKQVSSLEPIERPPQSHRKCNEMKASGVLLRGDTRLSALGDHIRPTYFVRPSIPLGLEEVDVTCKPLLQAPKSLRSLPAPRSAEILVPSGRKLNWFPPIAVAGGGTLCMQHAQVHCSVKDGRPCYTMTMEGSEEMMLARPDMQESHLSREGCTWQYSFHSGQSKAKGTQGGSGWRSWGRKENKASSDVSGLMHVSSAVQRVGAMASSRELVVSEFVLYEGIGAHVAQSQSLRFCSGDTARENPSMLGSSRKTACSLTPFSSAHPLSVSPAYSDMASEHNTRDLTATVETESGLHRGHRPSLSLDVWSVDLEPPDQPTPLPSPCSASHVELAAIVIQVSAESHKRESNGTDGDCISGLRSGWGLKFLDGLSSISSGVNLQEGLKPSYANDSSDNPSSRKSSGSVGPVNLTQNFHIPSLSTHAGLLGSLCNVTLLLPDGDHSLPHGGMRGPSSLIERWRSGGSCECGGWDLGCGMKVMSSNNRSETNVATLPRNQSIGLFSQGSRQELVLALILIKQGEFKLSFKAQLSSLKAFATAVAILHSHLSPSLLSSSRSSSSISVPPPEPPSTTPSISPSLPSSLPLASTTDADLIKLDIQERQPVRLTQDHAAVPRRSNSSTRDKLIPYLVLNKAFLN